MALSGRSAKSINTTLAQYGIVGLDLQQKGRLQANLEFIEEMS